MELTINRQIYTMKEFLRLRKINYCRIMLLYKTCSFTTTGHSSVLPRRIYRRAEMQVYTHTPTGKIR